MEKEIKEKKESKKASEIADKRSNEQKALEGIWSRAMALKGLKKVLRVSLEAAKIPTLDESGEVVDVKYNPSAANAATKAIETANKMLGYNLPDADGEEVEGDGELTVIFEGMEEYSL